MISELFSREVEKITSQIPASQPEVFNLEGAIDFLSGHGYPLTKGSLYGLVGKGVIPHHKIGKRLAFRRVELAEWIQQNTQSDVEHNPIVTNPNQAK